MKNDCVLGLFAIKCRYLKMFEYQCKSSPEVEFAEYLRKNIEETNIYEVNNLELECYFADDNRLLIV